MSTAQFTISVHNTNNSVSRSSAEKSAQTSQDAQRALFRAFIKKYIIGIVTAFVMLVTFVYSVYAATRIEYLPSVIILMVTLGTISYLLEKDGEQNG